MPFLFLLLFGVLLQKRGQRIFGGHSDEVFTGLSAEDADCERKFFNIPEAVRSSLEAFHSPMEAFCYPVVLRGAEHSGDLLFPRVPRTAKAAASKMFILVFSLSAEDTCPSSPLRPKACRSIWMPPSPRRGRAVLSQGRLSFLGKALLKISIKETRPDGRVHYQL